MATAQLTKEFQKMLFHGITKPTKQSWMAFVSFHNGAPCEPDKYLYIHIDKPSLFNK